MGRDFEFVIAEVSTSFTPQLCLTAHQEAQECYSTWALELYPGLH